MRFVLLTCLGLTLIPAAAQAHPHEWIDVRSTPVFTGSKITAIKEHWLFDEYYTALSLPDFDTNKNKKFDSSELMTLGRENVANLKDFSYFTFFEDNGSLVGFSGVSNITSTLEKGRIALDFTLTLAHPVDPKMAKVSYRIYDPSYYVSMRHEKTPGAIALQGAPAGCAYKLAIPSPDAVWSTLAKSLDVNARAPDDLGKYFAERVTLTCP